MLYQRKELIELGEPKIRKQGQKGLALESVEKEILIYSVDFYI